MAHLKLPGSLHLFSFVLGEGGGGGGECSSLAYVLVCFLLLYKTPWTKVSQRGMGLSQIRF